MPRRPDPSIQWRACGVTCDLLAAAAGCYWLLRHWIGALGGESMHASNARALQQIQMIIHCTSVVVKIVEIYYYGVAYGISNLSRTVSTISCPIPGGRVYRVGYIEFRDHVCSYRI